MNGTLFFTRSGFLVGPILRNTGSTLVHVAIELNGYVYEATWPRVKKSLLVTYQQHLRGICVQKPDTSWFCMEPEVPYNPREVKVMLQYAESQLGRPYMLRGWWQNREVDGIFCSQYVGNIIAKSNRIRSANFRESPISLYKKIQTIYRR